MAKPTINDVARVAGVSKKTVSRVINGSPLLSAPTRAKVEAAIGELGFVPSLQARALALGRNFLIALVYVEGDEDALPELARGTRRALAGGDFALVLRALPRAPEPMAAEFARFLDAHRPLGALLAPSLTDVPRLAALAEAAGCRVARLGGAPHDGARACDRLAADDRAATGRAVRWLAALGHRRIGLIAGPEETGEARARERGFLDAMAANQLDRGASLVANGDGGLASGEELGRLLLEVSPPPTALIAANPAVAAGALHAAAAHGLTVPRDLSLVACGDGAIARATLPPLSTLAAPLAAMAQAGARMLVDPAYAPPTAPFAAELVERGSTAPPRELELVNPLPAAHPVARAARG